MNKKHIIIRLAVILILASMLIPAFTVRIANESKNNDVVFALNYNSAYQALNEEEFEATLKENKKMGVKTVSIPEESLSTLTASGYLTCMNYGDIGTKFDEESEAIRALLEGDSKLRKESFLLITKRPEVKEYLDMWIGAKYSEEEYLKLAAPNGADIFVIYEGGLDGKKFAIGFNEKKIENAHNKGFDISLAMMFGGFTNTEYINRIGEFVDKYNIKYINLKNNGEYNEKSPYSKKNYEAMCKLIKEKKLYLIVTESQDQLSNQKPIGYQKLIDAAEGRVLRSYETVDFKNEDLVEARYHQILNSVVDRNLRFVIINQFTSGTDTFLGKSDKTNKATRLVMEKLESIGYNTGSYDTVFDYSVNRRLVSAIAVILTIVMGVTMLELLFKTRMKKLEILGIAASLLGGVVTLKAPESLLYLIPTLFASCAPCFAITVAMSFLKAMKEKYKTAVLTILTVIVTVGTLSLMGFIQATLLSGLDYYLNSLIFRGIKLSLIVPILYSFAAYGFIFNDDKDRWASNIIDFLNKEIRVYWVILGVGAVGVAVIYLIRSGNVTKISSIEALMRNSIADVMAARPRTKEFLIGWPSLVLLVYYIKNTDIKLIRWGFAVASSILFASVINSFCHVFTAAGTIYSRLFNGLFVGAFVAIAAVILNVLVIKFVKWAIKKYNLNTGR